MQPVRPDRVNIIRLTASPVLRRLLYHRPPNPRQLCPLLDIIRQYQPVQQAHRPAALESPGIAPESLDGFDHREREFFMPLG